MHAIYGTAAEEQNDEGGKDEEKRKKKKSYCYIARSLEHRILCSILRIYVPILYDLRCVYTYINDDARCLKLMTFHLGNTTSVRICIYTFIWAEKNTSLAHKITVRAYYSWIILEDVQIPVCQKSDKLIA